MTDATAALTQNPSLLFYTPIAYSIERVIYYYFAAEHQIWLMTLYGKDEAADLTAKEKKALKGAIEGERKAREAVRRKQ